MSQQANTAKNIVLVHGGFVDEPDGKVCTKS